VALNILPRGRKKQVRSRRWSLFTKLWSVALKDRAVPDISLNLYIILLTFCGNDDWSVIYVQSHSQKGAGVAQLV
jgi:hypothetical protein